MIPNQAFRCANTSGIGERSDRRVKPRRSANQIAASIILDRAAIHAALDDAAAPCAGPHRCRAGRRRCGAGPGAPDRELSSRAASSSPASDRPRRTLAAPRREGDHGRAGLIQEGQGIHGVVGRACEAKLLEKRHRGAGRIEAAAERARGFVDDPRRAVQVGRARSPPSRGPIPARHALVRPDMLPAADLRVQHLEAQGGAPDRRAGRTTWQKAANSSSTCRAGIVGQPARKIFRRSMSPATSVLIPMSPHRPAEFQSRSSLANGCAGTFEDTSNIPSAPLAVQIVWKAW